MFPNGTVVRALGLGERREHDLSRTFGLYFDPAWRPSWEADLIDWVDFGVPKDFEQAAGQIRDAFRRAQSGERVEIGCIGGLGRTGTALACMAVLAGIPVGQSVAWVRHNYHPGAVNNRHQEQWVEWFAGYVSGEA